MKMRSITAGSSMYVPEWHVRNLPVATSSRLVPTVFHNAAKSGDGDDGSMGTTPSNSSASHDDVADPLDRSFAPP